MAQHNINQVSFSIHLLEYSSILPWYNSKQLINNRLVLSNYQIHRNISMLNHSRIIPKILDLNQTLENKTTANLLCKDNLGQIKILLKRLNMYNSTSNTKMGMDKHLAMEIGISR